MADLEISLRAFVEVSVPDPQNQAFLLPTWQSLSEGNSYSKGDRVLYRGEIWESIVEENIWEPGVFGWVRQRSLR